MLQANINSWCEMLAMNAIKNALRLSVHITGLYLVITDTKIKKKTLHLKKRKLW
jgi:hypothetical protein